MKSLVNYKVTVHTHLRRGNIGLPDSNSWMSSYVHIAETREGTRKSTAVISVRRLT